MHAYWKTAVLFNSHLIYHRRVYRLGGIAMAGSTRAGSLGTYPWIPSSRTCGPLGTNNDAGDPKTRQWVFGDTPGPTGHNDHADPDSYRFIMKGMMDEG